MNGKIAIIAMLDEKGNEAEFLRDEIQGLGYPTEVLDIAIRDQLVQTPSLTRQQAINSTVQKKAERLRELYDADDLAGIIGIGGATGTMMATRIMSTLPFGVPKLAVSSAASVRAFAAKFIGSSDITLMHSVVEITGLSDVLKDVLYRAAKGICGMAEGRSGVSLYRPAADVAPRVALTQFNMCETCATTVRHQLEREGFQVVGFLAVGTGDRAMEEIIRAGGNFSAVIDLAPAGVGEELFRSDRAAGPTRLEAAGDAQIPQVISLACVNLMSPRKSKYKPEYHTRKKHDYDALRTFLRLSPEELTLVAKTMAGKLNQARGPVKVVVPLGGWSAVDARGTDMFDPELDKILVDALKTNLKSHIEVLEVDADLDTVEFAEAVLEAFHRVVA